MFVFRSKHIYYVDRCGQTGNDREVSLARLADIRQPEKRDEQLAATTMKMRSVYGQLKALLTCYLAIVIVSSVVVPGSTQPCTSLSVSVGHGQFSNDTYTGYVSENMNQQQESTPGSTSEHSGDLDKWRRTVLGSVLSRPVIYARFVDRLKPALLVTLTDRVSSAPLDVSCSCLSNEHLTLSLTSLDYDHESALDLFQLDYESVSCRAGLTTTHQCLCYFQIRLSDDPMVRDRLNREAKDAYKFQISALNSTTTVINLQVC